MKGGVRSLTVAFTMPGKLGPPLVVSYQATCTSTDGGASGLPECGRVTDPRAGLVGRQDVPVHCDGQERLGSRRDVGAVGLGADERVVGIDNRRPFRYRPESAMGGRLFIVGWAGMRRGFGCVAVAMSVVGLAARQRN